MAVGTTAHYGMNKADPGNALDTVDTELYRHATHHHTGAALTVTAPTAVPTLSLDHTAGVIGPSKTVYYRYSFVDSTGYESTASNPTSITTPAPISSPAAPSVVTFGTGGTLYGGDYYYVLTAWERDGDLETLALNATVISTGAGTTNRNVITFPALPTGASGFNIYRKVPGGVGYFLLATITMNVATPPGSFTDDGSVPVNCERSLPVANTTNADNSIKVCIGGATPSIPAGYVWRIYRTQVLDNWTSSLLTTVNTGDLCFVDTGTLTTAGAPNQQTSLAAPDKVLLTGGAEVQGLLPASMVTGFVSLDQIVTKTTTYAAAAGDIVLANATSAAFTITLPAATVNAQVVVKKIDSSTNAVTVVAGGATPGTIDGASSYQATAQYESVNFVCDGTNWFII